jgi:hypothetical protein
MKKFEIWSFYTILDTQTCEQSFKSDLKSSGALIGWHLKNRIIFEKCAFFLADTVQYSHQSILACCIAQNNQHTQYTIQCVYVSVQDKFPRSFHIYVRLCCVLFMFVLGTWKWKWTPIRTWSWGRDIDMETDMTWPLFFSLQVKNKSHDGEVKYAFTLENGMVANIYNHKSSPTHIFAVVAPRPF